MQPDVQGQCHSYYGTWNVNQKPPRVGVAYFMLDEHVKKIVETQKEKFQKEMSLQMERFTSSLKEIAKKQAEEIKQMQVSVSEITKFMYKLIDINKLKEPEIDKKGKKKVVKPKIEEDEVEEEFADGYL